MKLIDVIENSVCVSCYKTIDYNFIRTALEKNVYCCQSCIKEMNPQLKKLDVNGVRGWGFYLYEGKIKSLIFQYKGCYDIMLSTVFLNHFYMLLKVLCFNKVVVPVPSHKSQDKKRTFNHIKQMLNSLNIKYVDCLTKIKDVKQTSSTYKKRKEVGKWFSLNDKGDLLRGKNVLLFDDVLTTGSTIEACVNLLKRCKVRHISFIVVAYTSR